MATIKDAFDEVFGGFNRNTSTGNETAKYRKTVGRECIQWMNLIPSRIDKVKLPKNQRTDTNSLCFYKKYYGDIPEKYLVKRGDILIYNRHPYQICYIRDEIEEEIIIPNSFIVLRGIKEEQYNTIFIAYYLNKLFKDEIIEGNNGSITKIDIEDISIDDVPSIEKQNEVAVILKYFHERSNLFSNILENDDYIIEDIINRNVGDKND